MKRINIEQVLFFDIETAPLWPSYDEMPKDAQREWDHKFAFSNYQGNKQDPKEQFGRMGLHAEFSQIVCMSFGYISDGEIQIKSLTTKNEGNSLFQEQQLLTSANEFIGYFKDEWKDFLLCGYNIKGFDIPFWVKRLWAHNIPVPRLLNCFGLKPWEMVFFLDIRDVWKQIGSFGASLGQVCLCLGVPSPKDGLAGADVAAAWYAKKDGEIREYCQKDVIALINACLRLQGKDVINKCQVK